MGIVVMRYHPFVLGLILVAAAACRGPEDDAMSEPAPPPAAMIAPVRESMTLEEKLRRLDAELVATLRGGADGDRAMLRLHRAESITDRLLESAPPIEWLGRDYSLEARLRQLQAQADRVVAEQRRGAEPERIIVEVEALRREVADLRNALAGSGGGEAPPPLDSLLAEPPDSLREEAWRPPPGDD